MYPGLIRLLKVNVPVHTEEAGIVYFDNMLILVRIKEAAIRRLATATELLVVLGLIIINLSCNFMVSC